jgi:hypothetical protein
MLPSIQIEAQDMDEQMIHGGASHKSRVTNHFPIIGNFNPFSRAHSIASL